MGYSTDFFGSFEIDRPVDKETAKLLKGLATTRRMKRNIEGYGIEGEFYVNGSGDFGQGREDNIVDYNEPPSTQPGLWCQWILLDDNQTIEWDGGEKFYYYIEWVEYIINSILKPRNYILNGEVEWHGEEYDDIGKIIVKDNNVQVLNGYITFE